MNKLSRKKTSEEAIAHFQLVHGDRYDYSKVIYLDAHKKVEIICRKHGLFWQRANDHRLGKGCWDCSYEIRSEKTGKNKKKTLEQFIADAIKIHNDRYNYSLVKYNGSFEKIKILCKKHGIFFQSPTVHLMGSGCKKCTIGISKLEKNWLDSLNVPERQYQIKIKKKIRCVDGYDPNTNTVYEFYGDFWHGNILMYPKNKKHPFLNLTYGDLHQRTLDKENEILNLGFELVTIWENEWKNNMKGHK